jgi:hypothetical protein
MMDATGLRLLAQDLEGLRVVAAAVQDALARPADMRRDARSRSFGLELNRFQWERAGKRGPWTRSRAFLAFNDVDAVRALRIPPSGAEPLVLLDVAFDPADAPPAGVVRLVFAGGAEMRLDVECLDVTLMDTGPAWPTRRRPDHERRQ